MKSISLYTGAGGLDLGLEAVGFRPAICVEFDDDSRRTIELNKPCWKLMTPGNIHSHSPEAILEAAGLDRREVDLLVGGPPCQPYSKAAMWVNGKVPGTQDPRSRTINAFMRVARVALPRVILLENVIGLTTSYRHSPMKLLELALRRLNREEGTDYQWHLIRMNAVNYGVPQLRERIYLLAERSGLFFNKPEETHFIPKLGIVQQSAITAWEAIGDLDSEDFPESLQPKGKWAELLPSIPEGANYLWHTSRGGGKALFGWRTRYWSFLLKLSRQMPSWTISANPGPATGPFHWRNRLLSVHELSRLQSFPEGYSFHGSYGSVRRQIGNAVPPLIGEVIGMEVISRLSNKRLTKQPRFQVARFKGASAPILIKQVPKKFISLIGDHAPHPGVGLGPRAKLRFTEEANTEGFWRAK